jgi:integrase
MDWAKSNRPASYRTIRSALDIYVLSHEIASVPVFRLTLRRLEAWKAELPKKPAYDRSGKGRIATSKEEIKSRKSTSNRTVAWLRAALNYSKRSGLVKCNDDPWRLLQPFKEVTRSGRRGQAKYLTEKQLARLLDAIDDPAFLNLVKGAVYLGARYSELSEMRVGDLDADNGTVTVVSGKGGKTRAIFLGDNAACLLTHLCAGRRNDEWIFLKANGTAWGRNHQQKPIQKVIKAAGISPRISFHGLRASYCSLYLMADGNLFDLDKQLGHSSTQMLSQHYGHLANHHRQEQAKACEPQILGTGRPMGGTRDERLH